MAKRWLTSAGTAARAGKALALGAVVLSLPVAAQVPGDEIINVASATYATVGGGYTNTASAIYATISGGLQNRAWRA